MKKFYSFCFSITVMVSLANGQLVLNTQFINPCGGDEHNEFIVAKTTAQPVDMADICFGSYNPSSNSNGTGGSAVVDYNYWWAGTNTVPSPYPTFSSFSGESCGSGVSCYGFRYPSISADATDINSLIAALNSAAGCTVFVPVPSTDIIPANSNVIVFLGAGYRGTSALCGFDNLITNMNFSNHCSAGVPLTTYYAVFGNASGSGPTCSNTGGGYFSNNSRRISALHVFNGGSNTVSANYTSSLQDYTPGSGGVAGNAGLIIPNGSGGTTWINNQGCVPPPSVIVAITLEYFKGYIRDKKVTLNWKSSFEQDIKAFVMEKSLNGKDFYPLKNLLPSNISGTQYSTDDAKLASGNNYYRLKIINLNGTVEYSVIAKFNYSKGAVGNWFIYPNPVEGNASLQYQSDRAKNVSISITDITGKIISRNIYNVAAGTNNLAIPTVSLSRAMYVIKILSEENIETAIFIKK